MQKLKATLDNFVLEKNTALGLFTAPDPLQVAKIWVQNQAQSQAKNPTQNQIYNQTKIQTQSQTYNQAQNQTKIQAEFQKDFHAKNENYENAISKNNKNKNAINENAINKKSKNGEFVCLLCALFAYGNAKNIVNFLKKLDFSLLDKDESTINSSLACSKLKYRFQSTADIAQIFITLRRLKQESSLESVFCKGYERDESVLNAIKAFICKVREINAYTSFGYDFFFGKPFTSEPQSPLKRYNMLLRWLVRKDELDLGLWQGINKAHLLVPLDTHTHKVALKLGLMSRKSYDFKAVLELTNTLRTFDPQDPIKYDFALYRLGQSKEYLNL